MKKLLPLLVLLAIGVAFADGEQGTDWSPIVYPAQRLPLAFSHAKHAKRGTPCVACHASAASSQSAVDDLLPTEAACRACHAIDRAVPDKVVAGAPPARCDACHVGYTPGAVVARTYLVPPPLKFAHAAHATAPCASCHTDMTAVELATQKQLPTMASCLGCHKDGGTERHCADCHLAQLGGMLETRFPHGELVPHATGLGDGHGPGFATMHRVEATQVGATCTACHDRSECVACHQGVVKPLDFHPGNYLLAHAMDARRGKPDCSACHRAESFCVACHERSGLTTRVTPGFDATVPGRRFHPPSWASNSSLGAGDNLHAREAKRNITSCASCHREEDCLTCHSAEAGKLNASPHPRGWRGSSQCKALDRGNRRMCTRCHVTSDEVGCDWSR